MKKTKKSPKRAGGKIILLAAVLAAAVCATAYFKRPETAAESEATSASQQESGQTASSAASEPAASSAPSEVTRAETSVVDFFIEGEKESVPSTLYIGDGYSLYVPDDGWTVSKSDASVTWLSTDNDTVGFSITKVTGKTAAEVRTDYIADSGFEFEDLNGGGFGDPLLGWDEDGDALGIMSAEKGGKVYIIAWTYPEEAAEGFGARLQQIAETFELM